MDGYRQIGIHTSTGKLLEQLGCTAQRHQTHRLRISHILDDQQPDSQPWWLAQPTDPSSDRKTIHSARMRRILQGLPLRLQPKTDSRMLYGYGWNTLLSVYDG